MGAEQPVGTIRWADVAHEFEPDCGTLIDIYVLKATAAHWQAVLDLLSEKYRPLRYLGESGESANLPPAPEIFASRERVMPLLTFFVWTIEVDCHFFGDDEIEFSFDPRAVTGQLLLDEALQFLVALARVTGKPALMTGENSPKSPIFRASPTTGAVEYRRRARPRYSAS